MCDLLYILQYNFSFMELKQQIPDPTSLFFAHNNSQSVITLGPGKSCKESINLVKIVLIKVHFPK